MPEGLKLSTHLAAPTELTPKPDDKRFLPVPDRRCMWCRAVLSRYNPGNECSPCLERMVR